MEQMGASQQKRAVHVGSGHGDYKLVLTYTFVGNGEGNYDVTQLQGPRGTMCAYLGGGLAVVCVVALIIAGIVHAAAAGQGNEHQHPFLHGRHDHPAEVTASHDPRERRAERVSNKQPWGSSGDGDGVTALAPAGSSSTTPGFKTCDTSVPGWETSWPAGHRWWCCTTWSVGCDTFDSKPADVAPQAATTFAPLSSVGGAVQAPPFQVVVLPVPVPSPAIEPLSPTLPTGPDEEPIRLPQQTCPGAVNVAGFGQVELVNAMYNVPGDPAGKVEVDAERSVVPHMRGRTYFGNSCIDGHYHNDAYAAFRLLGKKLRYSTDLSGAGCGCNAALYLTSMPQNTEKTKCLDHYCDANNICGAACAEIDIQEANRHAYYATLHGKKDGQGAGFGYGAWRRDWDPERYGPGASCINTDKAFDVEVFFPTDSAGRLSGMTVTLRQAGSACELSAGMDKYTLTNSTQDGLQEMNDALAAGMTPIISYWGQGEDILWMDGRGDGKGPCLEDRGQCSETVKFFNFSISS